MLLRRVALISCTAVVAAAGLGASAAHAKPVDDACAQTSPSASPCIGIAKVAEASAAACRSAGAPEEDCVMPAGRDVLQARLDAYRRSWVHRVAALQQQLGDALALRDAQWLGTHNSFNSDANGVTLSHTDSNQQLTLTQQLDGDIRAIELDVHFVPSADSGGQKAVVVCHGRGPDQAHFGCTTEPRLAPVLGEVRAWLDANPGQVLLLYLEDELGAPQGYAQTVGAIDDVLGARVYRPGPVSGACENLPLGLSRADVRAAGAQVVLVGNCRAGWSSRVFGWDAGHVESGSTSAYRAYPACDATYGPDVYRDKLVRYFEDSTWLSATVEPTSSPADREAGSLTPGKVAAMTRCGVNLFGFDQFLPDDGRVEASIWSWAPDQPDPAAGGCAAQRPGDGRWISVACAGARPVACRTPAGTWRLTPAASWQAAPALCAARGAQFAPPRSGPEDMALLSAAGGQEPWLAAPAPPGA